MTRDEVRAFIYGELKKSARPMVLTIVQASSARAGGGPISHEQFKRELSALDPLVAWWVSHGVADAVESGQFGGGDWVGALADKLADDVCRQRPDPMTRTLVTIIDLLELPRRK